MKKITILMCLFISATGFSQTVLEDFEGTVPTNTLAGGFASATVEDNPDQTTTNTSAKALQLVTSATGDAWQESKLILQNTTIDMTTADKTMTVDIYSLTAVDFLFKLTDGEVGGASAALSSKTSGSHSGTGWETITLDFNIGADTGQPGYNPPNDKFGSIAFFPLYIYPNEGWNPAAATTTYVDNITAIAGSVAETCNDGIQNQDETGIDCGGSVCNNDCPVTPLVSAPEPPARDEANVISIYGDAYGSAVGLGNVTWDNGPELSEVTIVDSESALKLNMNFGAFIGSQLSTVVDATSMTHFHIDFFIGDEYTAGQVFNLKFSNHTGGSGETNAGEYNIAINGDGSQNQTWVSVDVELSSFSAGINPREALTQLLITTVNRIGVAYVDNVYFHNNQVLGADNFEVSKFEVYPNPTNGVWNVTSTSQISNISLLDVLGKEVLTLSPNNKKASIDGSSLRTGIYFAKIQGANGSKTLKLVRQ